MSAESPPPAPPTVDLIQLVKDVRDLRIVLRTILSVVFACISYFSFRALVSVPKFEMIFENMLGDKSKLPEISKLVIGWSRLGLVAFAIIIGFIVTGIILITTVRNIRMAGLAFVVCGVPLLMHLLICWSATYGPLIEVVKGLTGP
ncbi:MAG TPA: hypothetical protein VD994_22080 [Prosthecobacter sp.]|nr:hypothetical protein [Prosthecobacter sp.]